MAATLDSLEKLLAEIRDQNDTAGAKSDADKFEDALREFKSSLSFELSRVMGLPGNMNQPFAFIGQANQMIQDRRELMASLNKQSLAFGQSVTQMRDNVDVQEGSDMYGPTIALKTSIDALKFGVFGMSKNSLDLGMQMQAVGENSAALFKMQRESQVFGGLAASQMDSLSQSLKDARDQYGISTEYLVDAMGQLANRLMDFNLMGITADVQETVVALVSKYGAGTADLFTQAINSLTSGGNIAKFSRFGISEDVASLMESGGMTPEAIESIAAQAGQFFEKQVSNFRALNKAEAIAQAKAIYGEEGAMFAAIAKLTPQEQQDPNAVQEELKSQIDIQRDMSKSLFGINDGIASLVNYAPAQLLVLGQLVALTTSMLITTKAGSALGLLGPIKTLLGGLGGITASIATMVGPGIVGALGAVAVVVPLVVAIGALIYGLYKYFEDPEPIDIKPPKTGGNFVTNEYMAANAELTKSILGSVFASQQMLMLSQAKAQTAALNQIAGSSSKTARNTSGFQSPTVFPTSPLSP